MIKKLLNRFLKKDEFESFNSSALSKKTGITIFYFDNKFNHTVEVHYPFKNFIDILFVKDKNDAIRTLKDLDHEIFMMIPEIEKKFEDIFFNTKDILLASISRKCYNVAKFNIVRNLNMFGSHHKMKTKTLNYVESVIEGLKDDD